MELQQFAETVCVGIREKMGEDYRISVVTNLKMNSTEETGISFLKKDEPFSPTIYIDCMLDDYLKKKKSMAQIVREVIGQYEQSLSSVEEMRGMDVNLEACRNRIIYRLISRSRNRRLLEQMPYIPFLDLAVTFHVVVGITDQCVKTFKIDKKLQEGWGISVEQLLKLAKQNTERLLPLEITDMNTIIQKHMKMDGELIPTIPGDPGMIVITNRFGIYGASVVLYEDMIQSIADKLGCDLYVIPSSVHESVTR